MVTLCEVEVVVLLEVKLYGSVTKGKFESAWISIVLITSIRWWTMAKLFYNWSNIVGGTLGWESSILVKTLKYVCIEDL
jgi:hypothetical protein